jgi:hypothetical protein
MNILIAHNAYQHRGGEDSVVVTEVVMLCAHGNVVELYGRTQNYPKDCLLIGNFFMATIFGLIL